MIEVLGKLVVVAKVLLKAKEFRKMMPESGTKCNRSSPLCNKQQITRQTNEKPSKNVSLDMKVSGTLRHELRE